MDQTLQTVQKMLNKADGGNRLSVITEMEGKLNTILKEYMDCVLEIEYQTPTLEDLLTTPKIFADDGFRNAVENKGHGLQRAIIFSILRCYSEIVTGTGNEKKRTMILAVEEPELYMHPQAQRTIRRVFKNISRKGDQVIFSTHSALLLDVADFAEIIRVEAIQENINGVNTIQSHVWQLPMTAMIQDIKKRYRDVNATDESIREIYANAFYPMHAEGFFAKKVILVEGATEQYSLPIYAQALEQNFDNLNISVVDCGGKNCMDRLYRIFNELGIPCYLLFDYDKSNRDTKEIETSKQLLQLFRQPTDPPTSTFISQQVACFPEKWEADLASEIPDLPKLTNEARDKFSLKGDSGKPLIARYVARKLTSKTPPLVPPTLKSIIEKAVNVTWTGSRLEK